MKPKLKAPGTHRLKLECDMLLPNSAFKFNLCRYIKDTSGPALNIVMKLMVGQCRLTPSNPC